MQVYLELTDVGSGVMYVGLVKGTCTTYLSCFALVKKNDHKPFFTFRVN
jgi:hypothetical protein